MKKEIIIKYIDMITKDEYDSFIKKQNIELNDKEYEYLFYMLKNRYNDFFNNNELVINEIRNNINEKAFIKLYDLFLEYKKYL